MRRRNPWFLRFIALALLLSVTVCGPTPRAGAVSQEEIDALKERILLLDEAKETYSAEIEALSDDIYTVLERKKILDARIAATQGQIAAIEELILGYEEEQRSLEAGIEESRRSLAEAEKKAENTYELYCQRVRALEEEGAISYWNILFGSQNFADLLTRLDFVDEVLTYNEDVIVSYNDICAEITSHQKELETSLADLQEVINRNRIAREELGALSIELGEERAAASELFLEIMADQDRYETFLQLLDQEIAATDQEIALQEAALAAQREEAAAAARRAAQSTYRPSTTTDTGSGSGTTAAGTAGSTETGTGSAESTGTTTDTQSTSGSGFAWPVDSTRINSGFGHRDEEETGGVGSTNHQGIDIGGVGYGTSVGASKSGTVIRAGDYGDGYGNCVVIDHGDGTSTLYAHMDSLDVSVGDTVDQLEEIGVTGATGAATGPHLHFEIRVDGDRVNPEDYLP